LLTAECDLRLKYRAAIHELEARHRVAAARLQNPTITVDEAETCWGDLARLLPQLREAIAAYHLLSFGKVAERAEFIEAPELRDATIQSVLGRGFVVDDEGRILEVVLP